MSSCPDCGLKVDPFDRLDHCHGTLVVHSDRSMDCTDPGCVLPELLRHDLIIDCMAVIGGCCGAEKPADIAQAS
jgi:hypothetical protein